VNVKKNHAKQTNPPSKVPIAIARSPVNIDDVKPKGRNELAAFEGATVYVEPAITVWKPLVAKVISGPNDPDIDNIVTAPETPKLVVVLTTVVEGVETV